MMQLAKRSLPIAGILIVIAIFSFAYQCGQRSIPNSPLATSFRITGQSMAPTFLDGEVCQVEQLPGNLRIGDVVALRGDKAFQIKRLAALGGDIVDLADGRLLVRGRRLEDLIAERDERGFVSPALIPVGSAPEHWSEMRNGTSWMLYGHRNPHQGDRITAVMDDYPINDSVRRTLHPVDRLVLVIRPTGADAARHFITPCRVAFFSPEHSFVITTTNHNVARFRDAIAENTSKTMDQSVRLGQIDASHPIAVEINAQQLREFTLHVYREVEYRDDRPRSSLRYPVTLREDEVFVVGDNVPISVDSRSFGPIKLSSIIGRVVAKQSEDR